MLCGDPPDFGGIHLVLGGYDGSGGIQLALWGSAWLCGDPPGSVGIHLALGGSTWPCGDLPDSVRCTWPWEDMMALGGFPWLYGVISGWGGGGYTWLREDES